MGTELKHCPKRWAKGCYPRPCDTKPVPPTQPTQPTQPAKPETVHNVVYLVDEHDVSKDTNQQVFRNGATIIKRWAWHHSKVNLLTMNAAEVPDTIELHDMISYPSKNKTFKWEGYMFGKSLLIWYSILR